MTDHERTRQNDDLWVLAAPLGAFVVIVGEALLLAMLVPLLGGHGAWFGSDAGRIGSLVTSIVAFVLLVVGAALCLRARSRPETVARRFGVGSLIAVAVVVGAAGLGWFVSTIDLARSVLDGSVDLAGWIGVVIGLCITGVHAVGTRRTVRVLRSSQAPSRT